MVIDNNPIAMWIPIAALKKAGYKFVPYADFFKGFKGCHATPENGLNLRSAPFVDDNKIITLHDDTYRISFTQKVEE